MILTRRDALKYITFSCASTAVWGTKLWAKEKTIYARHYDINMFCNGSPITVKINGQDVLNYGAVHPARKWNIMQSRVLNGENTIEISFASIVSVDEEKLIAHTGPADDFFCEITMASSAMSEEDHLITKDPGTEERITLFKLGFDMKTGQVVTKDHDDFKPTVYKTPHMNTTEDFTLLEPGKRYAGGGWAPLNTIRIIKKFYLNDVGLIDHFHWQPGLPMKDTPKLREQLRDAYRYVHKAIENNRFDIIYKYMEPSWANVNYVLYGKADAQRYLRDAKPEEDFAPVNSKGYPLQPVRIAESSKDDFLDFTADRRLVQIIPPPIKWSNGKRKSEANFVFYMPEKGVLKPATLANAI